MIPTPRLKFLESEDFEEFFDDLRKGGAALLHSEVFAVLDGVGQAELHGQEEGLAFGRNKYPGIEGTVSNKQMGEIKLDKWLEENPGKVRADAIEARKANQVESKASREKNVNGLRRANRSLIAYISSCIEDSVMMVLKQDRAFEEARQGSCALTLVEALLNKAANSTGDELTDSNKARTKLEDCRMEGFEYFAFREKVNRLWVNGLRAKVVIKGRDTVSTIVRNLSRDVFPDTFRDFLLSKDAVTPSKWTAVTDLPKMWTVIDAEFVAWRTMNLGKIRVKFKEPPAAKEESTKEEFAGFIVDRVVEKLGAKRLIEEDEAPGGKSRKINKGFCHNYAETGGCPFGSKCRYTHESDRRKLKEQGYEFRRGEYRSRNEYEDRRDREYEDDRQRQRNSDLVRQRKKDRDREIERNGEDKKLDYATKALKAFAAALSNESFKRNPKSHLDNSDSSDSDDEKKGKAKRRVIFPVEANLADVANSSKQSSREVAMKEFLKGK